MMTPETKWSLIRHSANAATTLAIFLAVTRDDQVLKYALTALGWFSAILGLLLMLIGPYNFALGLVKMRLKGKLKPPPNLLHRMESRLVDVLGLAMFAYASWWWLFGLWLVQAVGCELLFLGYDLYDRITHDLKSEK